MFILYGAFAICQLSMTLDDTGSWVVVSIFSPESIRKPWKTLQNHRKPMEKTSHKIWVLISGHTPQLHVDDKCTLDHDLLWKPTWSRLATMLVTRQFPRKRSRWSMLFPRLCFRFLWWPAFLAKWRLYWNASANLLKQAGPPKDLPKFLYHWAHKGCTFPSGYPCSPGSRQFGRVLFEKKKLGDFRMLFIHVVLSLRLPGPPNEKNQSQNTPWSKYLRWDTLDHEVQSII